MYAYLSWKKMLFSFPEEKKPGKECNDEFLEKLKLSQQGSPKQ